MDQCYDLQRENKACNHIGDMQDEKRLSERKCHVPPPHQIDDQHHLT